MHALADFAFIAPPRKIEGLKRVHQQYQALMAQCDEELAIRFREFVHGLNRRQKLMSRF